MARQTIAIALPAEGRPVERGSRRQADTVAVGAR